MNVRRIALILNNRARRDTTIFNFPFSILNLLDERIDLYVYEKETPRRFAGLRACGGHAADIGVCGFGLRSRQQAILCLPGDPEAFLPLLEEEVRRRNEQWFNFYKFWN